MMEIERRLDEILGARKQMLPEVAERLAALEALEMALEEARRAGAALPHEWSSDPGVRDALANLGSADLDRRISQAKSVLQGVQARFSRDSINVGVSGRARVGKSTMLQAISGLSDEQVPTGEGANVTAVRSQIFHSTRTAAVIGFHNPTTFIDEVVLPYYRELDMWPEPASLELFLRDDLSRGKPATDTTERYKAEARWKRLLEIQRATPHLRLDGGTATLTDLSDLRRYVAYPTTDAVVAEDEGGASASRDYLSVRECRLEAPFPVSDVAKLGLVDLPGLGESASGIDTRIVAGLKGDVDVVLMVFRAAVGLANVDDIDREARGLVAMAQGPLADSRDFAWLMINAGPADGSTRDALIAQLERDFNEGERGSQYTVLVGDARDPESMHRDVLVPVLSRLAERLPEMDRQYLDGSSREIEPVITLISGTARDLANALSAASSTQGTIREDLDILAGDLRRDIQASLFALNPDALVDGYVERYVAEIEQADEANRLWLADGLGLVSGREEWMQIAEREFGVNRSHRPFAIAELHRLRVAVTTQFSSLEGFVNGQLVEGFYQSIAEAVAGQGDGMPNKSGADRSFLVRGDVDTGESRIDCLWHMLEQCDPPVPGLVTAVGRLKGIRFDFRMQAYPVLHDLNLDMRPVDGANGEDGYPPEFAEAAVGYMYDWFESEFNRFSYDVKKALQQEASRQFRVLTGAAVVFEDEVVRSGTSSREFRNLVDGYRDELWPGRFDDLNSTSARVKQLLLAAKRVSTAADAMGRWTA